MQQNTIDQIADQLMTQDINDQTIQALRNAYSEIHFTYCMDDDIHSGSPVKETEKFNMYLVNSSETCLSLTSNMESATGLVIAEIIADDDE